MCRTPRRSRVHIILTQIIQRALNLHAQSIVHGWHIQLQNRGVGLFPPAVTYTLAFAQLPQIQWYYYRGEIALKICCCSPLWLQVAAFVAVTVAALVPTVLAPAAGRRIVPPEVRCMQLSWMLHKDDIRQSISCTSMIGKCALLLTLARDMSMSADTMISAPILCGLPGRHIPQVSAHFTPFQTGL